MFNKKIILILTIVLVSLLTVSAISAADNVTDDIVGVEEINEEIAGDVNDTAIARDNADQAIEEVDDDAVFEVDEEILSSSQDGIIKESDNGTFTALQNKINAASADSTITLENDYAFDDGFDFNGIKISKDLTIDGKNHTIDAKSESRIFYLNSETIILKNIIFKGGNSYYGSAIYNEYDDNCIISCDFVDCSGDAIRNYGVDCIISSCDFVNCSGGAIRNYGNRCNVSSCDFVNCSSYGEGGAIFNHGVGCIIGSCNFVNCSSDYGGGAISNNCVKCIISSCNFANCFSNLYGGAIFNYGGNCIISSCDFANCFSNKYGGAIANGGYDCTVSSCNFTECYSANIESSIEGAIYNDGDNFIVKNCNYNGLPVKYIIATVIVSSPVTTAYNGNKYLVVTLKDRRGTKISGVKVTVVLGSKTYNPKTDYNGQVKVSTNGLAPVKTYTATITFAGNSKYTKSTKTVKVTVKKATPKLAAKSKAFKKKVKTKKYTIKLKTNKNKAMKKVKVTLKIKGKKAITAKTNKKGVATFKIKNLKKKGTFKSTVTYKGNKYYNKVTKKVKIKIK